MLNKLSLEESAKYVNTYWPDFYPDRILELFKKVERTPNGFAHSVTGMKKANWNKATEIFISKRPTITHIVKTSFAWRGFDFKLAEQKLVDLNPGITYLLDVGKKWSLDHNYNPEALFNYMLPNINLQQGVELTEWNFFDANKLMQKVFELSKGDCNAVFDLYKIELAYTKKGLFFDHKEAINIITDRLMEVSLSNKPTRLNSIIFNFDNFFKQCLYIITNWGKGKIDKEEISRLFNFCLSNRISGTLLANFLKSYNLGKFLNKEDLQKAIDYSVEKAKTYEFFVDLKELYNEFFPDEKAFEILLKVAVKGGLKYSRALEKAGVMDWKGFDHKRVVDELIESDNFIYHSHLIIIWKEHLNVDEIIDKLIARNAEPRFVMDIICRANIFSKIDYLLANDTTGSYLALFAIKKDISKEEYDILYNRIKEIGNRSSLSELMYANNKHLPVEDLTETLFIVDKTTEKKSFYASSIIRKENFSFSKAIELLKAYDKRLYRNIRARWKRRNLI